MKVTTSLTVLCLMLWICCTNGQQECSMLSRPADLVAAERKCEAEIKTDESVVNKTFRKIQESFKNAFNATRSLLASLKERFESDKSSTTTEASMEDKNSQPKNCEYYECVFRDIKVTDENGTADAMLLASWIAENVAASLDPKKVKTCLEDYAGARIDMLDVMTEGQAQTTENPKTDESLRETFGNMANNVHKLNREMHIKLQHALTGKEQSCLQTEGLMRCLSSASIDKCRVFQY